MKLNWQELEALCRVVNAMGYAVRAVDTQNAAQELPGITLTLLQKPDVRAVDAQGRLESTGWHIPWDG